MKIISRPFSPHDDSRLRYVRRVETRVVEDGTFSYSGGPLEDAGKWAAVFRKLCLSDREQAIILYLARDFVPIGYDLWLGGVDFVTIDPRRVLIIGAQILASKMVILHNHPMLSQHSASPSDPDAAFCMQMSNLGAMMGIVLEDFIVIHSGGYVSFKENQHPALRALAVQNQI